MKVIVRINRKNGTPTITVEGGRGEICEELTRSLEQRYGGHAESRDRLPEFYERPDEFAEDERELA